MFPSCYSKSTDGFFQKTSLAKILIGVFIVYMLHTCWVIYGFVYTKPCEIGSGEHCISSYLATRPQLQLSMYSCSRPDESELNLITKIDDFDIHTTFERTVNVSLPEGTHADGTLYVVVYIHQAGVSPLEDRREVHQAAKLTTHVLTTSPHKHSLKGYPPQHHVPQGYPPQHHVPQGHTLQDHTPPGQTNQDHTPQDHTPQEHTPQDHTPQDHTPQGHTPPGQTNQDHTPQGHTPQDHAPQDHTPQDHAPHGQTPQGQTPQGQTPQGQTPQDQTPGPPADSPRQSHWRSRLTLSMMSEDFSFTRGTLPSDVRRYMRVYQDGRRMTYLPLLLIDELSFRVRDLMEINSTTTKLPLTVSYKGISLRTFRFWVQLQDVVFSLRQFGFTEENIDEIKGILVDSNLYLLALTALVTAFHLLCELLAFKNDISFWKRKKSMAGMSRKSVLWRCFSTLVIFLHLLEEDSSLPVLLPVALGSIIEVWKVKKVFKIQLPWKNSRSIFEIGKLDDSEKRTIEHDTQAMRYLSYLLYPLCISGVIFSLVYLKYKSYYSWLINSLVTGVYAFGSLSMMPQLYINHKIQSVGHMQGTVLMYRGISALVNDIYSSLFSSHSSLPLSCFRDEVLFLVYLYQRRLYAVSKTSGREYRAAHSKKLKAQ